MIRYPGIEGRVALVAGAAPGIGLAIAARLAAEGARVVLNDVNAAKLDESAEGIGDAAPFDVADREAVHAGLERVRAQVGSPEILVANHAVMTMAPLVDDSEENWTRTLEVNLVGTAFLLEECVPDMVERGYGRIVAIASEWGAIGWPEATAYTASKGGIIALVRSAALALAANGIAVNAIAPGVTDTEQLEVDARAAGVTRAEIVERYGTEIPLGRVGRPSEIAAVAAYLVSEAAAPLVGQILSPNGGTTTALVT